MKRETFKKMMEMVGNEFSIVTNICEGNGIYGVSFYSFEQKNYTFDGKEYGHFTTINYEDDFAIITYSVRDKLNIDTKTFLVPYENIVMVCTDLMFDVD
jgi:hypothetical protein